MNQHIDADHRMQYITASLLNIKATQSFLDTVYFWVGKMWF